MTCDLKGRLVMRSISLIVLLTLLGSPAYAVDDFIAKHPNADVVAFYTQNWDQIDALRRKIENGNTHEERLESFSNLATAFPLAAEVTARGLVTDNDTDLAIRAIQFLKLSSVMSDHDMSTGMENLSPEVAYAMQRHMDSRAALRLGVVDPRSEIRAETAPYLASLSDEPSLQAISDSVGEVYSDAEAANLFTLASGDIGEEFLNDYIGKGSAAAQQTAVSYLSAIPSYQDQIRSEYFLNPDAPVDARTAAARSLAAYDRSFPEYALAVTGEANENPGFIGAAVQGYIAAQNLRGTPVQPDIARALQSRLSESLSDTDQNQIPLETMQSLEQLQSNLDAIMSTDTDR